MIAYLIIAHNEPEHFARLVDALQGTASVVVAHIDLKSDIAPFVAATARDRARFVEDRVSVNWAGWSQVEASLRLLADARRAAPDSTHFALLSGSHYPIAPDAEILARHAAMDGDAIESRPLPLDRGDPSSVRVRCRYVEGGFRNGRAARLAIGALNRALRLMPDRRIPAPFDRSGFRIGSQWWTLSRASADHVLDFPTRSPAAHAFFRRAMTPDESYFQTVLATRGAPPADGGATLTYTDWSDPREAPCHLAARHLALFESPAFRAAPHRPLFARKFSRRNADLVAQIDRRLR